MRRRNTEYAPVTFGNIHSALWFGLPPVEQSWFLNFMLNFSLQKALRKPEINDLLRQLAQSCSVNFSVFDHNHRCVWGDATQREQSLVITYQGTAIGQINIDPPGDFETLILQTLNYIIQTEYEKKQLAQDTLQKYEEVVFLSEFSNQIASCTTLKEMGIIIRNEIRQLIDVDEIFIFLYDQCQDQLRPFIYKTEQSLQHFQAIPKIIRRVLTANRAEVIDNIRQDQDFIPEQSPVRSLLCSPLTIQNKIIGILGLAHYQEKHFTSTDLNLFSTLTTQVAAAIQTAQYYDTIKDYSQTLESKVQERTLELELAKQQLEKVNKRLERLAIYDELTQIPNRRYFSHYLEQEWRQCLRDSLPISIILCDVDYFKNYNDCYGHQMGDDCLKHIAQIMQNCLKRPSDLLARYGGEEFIIILPYTNRLGSSIVAERIHDDLRKAAIPHEGSLTCDYVTVSLGIGSTVPMLHYHPEDLVKIADQAMYESKAGGRNQTTAKALCLQLH
ncbi:MAG: diguanylate cyclase [Synechocystis sp.]|nr:diguanylate cyclase [Synechocystis sp.]